MKQAHQIDPSTPRIALMPALRLVGLSRRYPATPEAMQLLAQQWQEFSRGPGGRIMDQGGTMYGVHIGLFGDSQEDEYFAGVELAASEPVPAGLADLRVPSLTCAVIDHRGPVSEISHTTSALLRDGLRESGKRLASTRPFDLIERYGPKFDPEAARGDIQLIVPVED